MVPMATWWWGQVSWTVVVVENRVGNVAPASNVSKKI